MPEIEIGPEQETQTHWRYPVQVFAQGKAYAYEVSLSFQDYDLWSHGSIPPSKVVEKAFLFLLSKEPASSILPKFDCSQIRRYFPEVDAELPRL